MKKATLQTDGTWKVEEFTSEEETDYNATVASGKKLKEDVAAAATKKTTDAASATTKLKALGLTDDEIAALIG
tara:strand:- start:1594 stop:1812 length:219 start_codon:yes stop_codon:yes gene_type:complete